LHANRYAQYFLKIQNDNYLSKRLYILSGLGADEQVFQRLDFSGFATTFIKWKTPHENESIEQYAKRLLDQITTIKPTIIGLSFGGIIAIEIAKQIETEKVILISSAKTKFEIPFYFRFIGLLRIHRLFPTTVLKSSNFLTNYFFGAKTHFERQLLKQILKDTDSVFLKWAIEKITRWTNQSEINNLFHIHGAHDRILPSIFIKCNLTIKNGGHLMILSESEQMNIILKAQL
jgi:pimeloyl-ACP methyl ester carboxylesterase